MRKREPGKLGAKWERRYFVLYKDGKLKYYDSRSLGDEKGSLGLRFFYPSPSPTPTPNLDPNPNPEP